ncbi:YeiH family putative sulfate export transporter [Paenibacillus sp. JNUCC31]|uniref:YeiH family protein n=1 Tax=Paenibacillus sp. JNUCC-31 TaxID=2777983 RepID=UPI001787461E|nr:YeiH family protein [Paenibacillus sp. JNUCC-31]QOS78874.1 YeiH family putative sulfate export transporter [Paenibacillus sp. JNUCC-31]
MILQTRSKSGKNIKKVGNFGFFQGVGLTLLLSVIAKLLGYLPFLNIMGQLVIAIMLGLLYRGTRGVPLKFQSGISFSGKRLLRFGIILLGLKLNLLDIVHAGYKVVALAAINVVITIIVVYGLCKWFKIDKRLGLLTACGTAICGAAAVVAIAPQIKAKDEETAVSAATVAILGTMFTLVYTFLYPVLGLSMKGYGVFTGATLHEVAHVIAAAAPGGQAAIDMAVLVKLTRVAMLVPVALFIGLWSGRESRDGGKSFHGIRWRELPIPWFIFGFLVMSGVNTLGIIPEKMISDLLILAYMLLAMAMAGLGLGVDLATFSRLGKKPFLAGLIGSIVLSLVGFVLVCGFGLN